MEINKEGQHREKKKRKLVSLVTNSATEGDYSVNKMNNGCNCTRFCKIFGLCLYKNLTLLSVYRLRH